MFLVIFSASRPRIPLRLPRFSALYSPGLSPTCPSPFFCQYKICLHKMADFESCFVSSQSFARKLVPCTLGQPNMTDFELGTQYNLLRIGLTPKYNYKIIFSSSTCMKHHCFEFTRMHWRTLLISYIDHNFIKFEQFFMH